MIRELEEQQSSFICTTNQASLQEKADRSKHVAIGTVVIKSGLKGASLHTELFVRGVSSIEYELTCGKAILRSADSWVFLSTLSSRGCTTSWVSIPDRITNNKLTFKTGEVQGWR